MSKRPIVINKYITNNTTNNNCYNTTNNDNRVTNNHNHTTYVVRTKRNEPPRQYVDEKGVPKTNVANVNWDKLNKTWRVQWVNAQTGKQAYVGRRKDWHDAVRLREEHQKTEGTRGPGELEFREDGEAVVVCGQCRHTFGLASYAPEPCKNKKEFAKFEAACEQLQSEDPEAAKEAEALLAVMPIGRVNKALRRSVCRGCRDALRRSETEGENNATATCLATKLDIQADMALKGCQECNESRPECLTCEHHGRKGKPEGCESILDHKWFANKYKERGPEKMWEAYRNEHVVVLCKCCHFRQPTHSGAQGADSSTLEPGSKAKLQREYAEANGAYNHKRKREFVNVLEDGTELPPGHCYYCGNEYVCDEGYELAFQWMHKVEELKNTNISKLAGGHLCPATAVERMDAEIDGTDGSGGCNLGCANCHWFCETLPRSKEGTEKWDKLMENPIKRAMQ